jgi:hypothetical protein
MLDFDPKSPTREARNPDSLLAQEFERCMEEMIIYVNQFYAGKRFMAKNPDAMSGLALYRSGFAPNDHTVEMKLYTHDHIASALAAFDQMCINYPNKCIIELETFTIDKDFNIDNVYQHIHRGDVVCTRDESDADN